MLYWSPMESFGLSRVPPIAEECLLDSGCLRCSGLPLPNLINQLKSIRNIPSMVAPRNGISHEINDHPRDVWRLEGKRRRWSPRLPTRKRRGPHLQSTFTARQVFRNSIAGWEWIARIERVLVDYPSIYAPRNDRGQFPFWPPTETSDSM